MNPLRGPMRRGSIRRNPLSYFLRRIARKLIFLIVAVIIIVVLYFMGYLG